MTNESGTIGYWLLAIGCWLLAVGYWLLAVGYGGLAEWIPLSYQCAIERCNFFIKKQQLAEVAEVAEVAEGCL